MSIIYENKDHQLLLQINHNHFLKWPLHQHYHIEMLYFTEGSLNIEYQKSDGSFQTVTIHAGELFFIFPNVPHKYFPTSEKTVPDFYCYNFSPDISKRFHNIFLEHTLENPLLNMNDLDHDIPFILKRFSNPEIVQESREIIIAYLTLLYERLMKYFVLQKPFISKTLNNSDALCIINHIQKHYNENITLDTISQAIGISKFNLSRFFSFNLNISLRTYINALRIRNAQSLLINTDFDITRILFDCGYQNQQTFNRIFKEFAGCTPTEYRNRYRPSVTTFHAETVNDIIYYEQLNPRQQICYRKQFKPVLESVIIPEK